jgi:ubiquinone/menaquinone biosynthesis C-methylase UbiE
MVDISKELKYHWKDNIELGVMDARSLEYENDSFDTVIATFLLSSTN